MPDQILANTVYEFAYQEWKYFDITTLKNYARIEISTSVESGHFPDIDLYEKVTDRPTLTSFDAHSAAAGNTETLTIYGLSAGTFHFGAYCFSGDGKVYVQIKGYASETAPIELPIDDVGNDVGNNLDNTGDNINNTVGDINVTINQDTTAIANSIIEMKDTLENTVANSIAASTNQIVTALMSINNMNNNVIGAINTDLTTSYNNSAKLVTDSLDSIDYDMGINLKALGLSVKDGLTESANSMYAKVGEPLLIGLKDLSENVKGISNNMIDDILRSVFTKIEGT